MFFFKYRHFYFLKNLPTFLVTTSLLFYTNWKGSEKSFLIRSSHHLFNILTGYPAGYRISGKSGYLVQPYIELHKNINKSIPCNTSFLPIPECSHRIQFPGRDTPAPWSRVIYFAKNYGDGGGEGDGCWWKKKKGK